MTNVGHVGKIAEPARTDVGPSIHRKKQGQISAIPMLSILVAGTRQLSDGPCSITSGRGTRQTSDGPILDSPFAGTRRMLDIPERIKTAAQYPPFLRPARWKTFKRRYQTGFRLRGKSPSNPCIRPLPGSCRLTQQKRLYMKKFSRCTAISPKQIGDFFRRFLKRSCPASPANFKQQRDMDDNDGNKKRRQQCAASVFVHGFQSPFFTLTLSFP
ncbi:hypothetical protein Cdeb_00587 [Caldibacillus debilis GB1]|jgi:hypothetical protein|uniref:Uncharacterized protein n=1 Tax=Caldibacillus debilis GB1 TaxID=1339248 RepID=A0A420VGZ5_9BACI|nr:hypothetical protein Cdeb_00587 [Caldibacillus debilis GB1]